jgi:predicted HTH transcriptional regulator
VWGSGIQRMTTACLQAGLPEPELEEIGSGFRATLRHQAKSQAAATAVREMGKRNSQARQPCEKLAARPE